MFLNVTLNKVRYGVSEHGSLEAWNDAGDRLWELPLHPGPLGWVAAQGDELLAGDLERTTVYRVDPRTPRLLVVSRLELEGDYTVTPRSERLATRINPLLRQNLSQALGTLSVCEILGPRDPFGAPSNPFPAPPPAPEAGSPEEPYSPRWEPYEDPLDAPPAPPDPFADPPARPAPPVGWDPFAPSSPLEDPFFAQVSARMAARQAETAQHLRSALPRILRNVVACLRPLAGEVPRFEALATAGDQLLARLSADDFPDAEVAAWAYDVRKAAEEELDL